MISPNARCTCAALLLWLALIAIGASVGAQSFSHILSFQGRLCGTDGKPLPDGPYIVQFAMYSLESGGTALWTENQGVTQVGGAFVAYLGSVTAFPTNLFSDGDRWLGITVGGDPEMPDRFRLTPSPWAIRAAKADQADDADTVDGLHASSTPGANQLLALDAAGKWPLSTIPQGHGSGLDADLLDGLHATDFWTKASGGPFVQLAPPAPETGAAASLVGTGAAPALRLLDANLALCAETSNAGRLTADWTQRSPTGTPSARAWPAMAYDSESDRVILFGGEGGTALADTWAYSRNSDTWTQMLPAASPSARMAEMAYDSESDRVVLFDGALAADTWIYDYNTDAWTRVFPAQAPSARWAHAMAYDSESDRVILFGGSSGLNYYGDTWAYDLNTNTWTRMFPARAPGARWGHAMAYDAASDRVILFGGCDNYSYPSDTWAYDYNTNTWTQTASAPRGRYLPAMAYDAQIRRTIVFSGNDWTANETNDTWAFDWAGNTWTVADAATRPPVREAGDMAYDSESGCSVMFGGMVSGGRLGDTWTLGVESPYRSARFVGDVDVAGDLWATGVIHGTIAGSAPAADTLGGLRAGNGAGQIPISNGDVCATLNADLLDGYHAGNAAGQVAVSNGTLCTSLNADLLDGFHAGNAGGQVAVSNGTLCTSLNADLLDGFHAGNAGGRVPVSNGTLCTNLNADLLDGFHAGNAGGQVPVSNGTLCTNLNADVWDGHHWGDKYGDADTLDGIDSSRFLYDQAASNRAYQAGCAQYTDNTLISFSQPFSYYPVVVANAQAAGVIATIESWNISGFRLRLTKHDGTTYTGTTYVHWIAIGNR